MKCPNERTSWVADRFWWVLDLGMITRLLIRRAKGVTTGSRVSTDNYICQAGHCLRQLGRGQAFDTWPRAADYRWQQVTRAELRELCRICVTEFFNAKEGEGEGDEKTD